MHMGISGHVSSGITHRKMSVGGFQTVRFVSGSGVVSVTLCVTIGSPIVRIYSQVADLGSAYKLAPQSPGLPQTERLSIGVLKLILKLREVSSLSVRTIYRFLKRTNDQTYVNKHQQTYTNMEKV